MFQLDLSNRFEALQLELEPNNDVKNTWVVMKSMYRAAAEEKLGYKKKKKKDRERWISKQT